VKETVFSGDISLISISLVNFFCLLALHLAIEFCRLLFAASIKKLLPQLKNAQLS
jgi:hypothetical protein